MKPIFRRVAVIGKYQVPVAGSAAGNSRLIIESIARFFAQLVCEPTLVT